MVWELLYGLGHARMAIGEKIATPTKIDYIYVTSAGHFTIRDSLVGCTFILRARQLGSKPGPCLSFPVLCCL